MVPLTVAPLVWGALPPAAAGINPSLCLAADEGCLAPGGIQIRVILGASDAVILGGQFTVGYDPHLFSLMDATPGRACDPTSPFALEVFQDDDHSEGEVRCAFGVDFREGLPPAGVATTLACLSFAPIGDAANPTPVCLLEGQHPFAAALVDDTGHRVLIDNSQDCPPDSPSPILACVEVAPGVNCSCVPDTADCHALDTPCRIGVCDPLASHCEVVFVNEGGPCDDGDSCTPVDRCSEGICVGEGCRNSSFCAGSSTCLGIVPPLTVGSRFEDQRAAPVRTSKGRSADDGLFRRSVLP